MYYTEGDSGMEVYPHTQSAVHNFLGTRQHLLEPSRAPSRAFARLRAPLARTVSRTLPL